MAPVPYVIAVGESEYEAKLKAEAQRKQAEQLAEAQRKKNEQAIAKPAWSTYTATAFTAGPESTGKSPGDAAYGITTSGRYVRANHTLACPKSIALGTRIEIEGLGVRTCDDRGAAITEGRLDIYFENVTDARQFGRRTVRARILK